MPQAAYSASPETPAPPPGPPGDAVAALRERMVPWYERNKRDLPWRHTRDPYQLVVAELMLQQTGVDRIRQRWIRFVERFPSWVAVAAATPGDVIREWQGIGYNRRAVSLHRMAVAVVERHGGCLPRDRAALLALPGIGPYTANAILSFVHSQDVPAIDVNLRRVIGRVAFGNGHAPIENIARVAAVAIAPGRGSDWNQALMDFAALQCTLRRPACLFCPLSDVCRAVGGEVAAPRPTRVAAERRAPYRGSTRYQRGRIIDLLRESPSLTAEELGARLAVDLAGPVDLPALLAGLLRDGLIQSGAGANAGYQLP